MSSPALVEFCRVTTEDGLTLDGVCHAPVDGPAQLPVDACLLVHGTGSNFYAHGLLETFCVQSVAAGVTAYRINTRGHDGICTLSGPQKSMRGGATFENISECRNDLRAWLRLLASRGHERVALVGHSMGGVKALFSQGLAPEPNVACVVGISPPRFCHANFAADPRAEAFRQDYARARRLLECGQPEQLMQVTQPLPMLATARGYLAKYGPHDDYDFVRYLPRIDCPVLIVLGEKSVETSPAFAGLPEILRDLADAHRHVELTLVPDADIHYAACPSAPFDAMATWLCTPQTSAAVHGR